MIVRRKDIWMMIAFIVLTQLLFNSCRKAEIGPEKKLIFSVIFNRETGAIEWEDLGIQLATDAINNADGISNGYLIGIDNRSYEAIGEIGTADMSVIVAKASFEAHKENLIGVIISSSTESRRVTQEVGEPNRFPVFSATSTSNANTNLSPYFHRLAPPDKYQAKLLAQKSISYGINSVSIAVQTGDLYAETLSRDFLREFENMGGVVNDTVLFDSITEFDIEKLEQLYAKNSEILLVSFVRRQPELLNEIKDKASVLGIDANNLRFMFPDAGSNAEVARKVPAEFLIGTVNNTPRSFGTHPFPDNSTPEFKFFASAFRAAFNAEPKKFSAFAYDVVHIYALALEKAFLEGYSLTDISQLRIAVNENIRVVSRPDEGDVIVRAQDGWVKMKEALKNGGVNYEGASGNCDIDDEGNVVSNYDVVVFEKQGGVVVVKSIENVSPSF
jgi:neutral amino acid transport system substrate-binding protein